MGICEWCSCNLAAQIIKSSYICERSSELSSYRRHDNTYPTQRLPHPAFTPPNVPERKVLAEYYYVCKSVVSAEIVPTLRWYLPRAAPATDLTNLQAGRRGPWALELQVVLCRTHLIAGPYNEHDSIHVFYWLNVPPTPPPHPTTDDGGGTKRSAKTPKSPF